MKKICFITAVPGTARVFLKNHVNNLHKKHAVYLVSSSTDISQLDGMVMDGVKEIHIHRKISIWNDIKSLVQLCCYFKSMHFDAVHSVTPKAGLLTAIAAKIVGAPERIHIFTGQVWATKKGVKRKFLKLFDKIIVKLDNHILVDGYSQLYFLEQEGIIKKDKAIVLGGGSICGVDTERFVPDTDTRDKVRQEINVKDDTVVYAFMGRFNREKGIIELFKAFSRLTQEYPNTFLLLIGKDEMDIDKVLKEYPQLNASNYLNYGFCRKPEILLQSADVFCLPSYREGFGMSVIEAQCLGLPAICSDIYGLKDTIVDNQTGLRCKVSDETSLYDCMKKMYTDDDFRKKCGAIGRQRILNEFSSKIIEDAWLSFYDTI